MASAAARKSARFARARRLLRREACVPPPSRALSVSCAFCPRLGRRAPNGLPVLEGSIARVAASSSHVAAVRAGEVWILRDDGTLLTRLTEPAPNPGPVAKDARAHLRQAETILDVAGVSEFDRDSDWAIDLLEDERTLAQRTDARDRPAPGRASPAASPALAASRTEVWIARRQDWFRVDASGRVIRQARGDLARAWAAADGQLLVARADGLALFSPGGEGERFLALPSPADQVALSASGRRWAWSGPTGTRWSDGTSTDGLPPGPAAVDLAYCGETLLVLLPDVLLAVAPGHAPEVRVRDLQAHRVVCPASGAAPWLALGRQLLVSFDGGHAWAPVAAPPGHVLVDVTATEHHLWLATRSGLYVSAPAGAAASPRPASAAHRPQRRQPNAWWSWLPQVSVRATTSTGRGERAFEALAFAQFAIDRPVGSVVSVSAETGADSPPPSRAERPVDLRDPDGACLGRARRRAVETAMAEPGTRPVLCYPCRPGRLVAGAACAGFAPLWPQRVARRGQFLDGALFPSWD